MSSPLRVSLAVLAPLALASLPACCPCWSGEEARYDEDGLPVVSDEEITYGSLEAGKKPPEAAAQDPDQPTWSTRFPSSEYARALLREAKPHKSGDVDRDLLLCDVLIRDGKNFDTFADPDPSATVTLGGRKPLYVRGGEDTTSMLFSIPNASIQRGERFELFLVDRDVTSDDTIGEVSATYEGDSPLALEHDNFRAVCHLIPREAVEPMAVRALKAADHALVDFPGDAKPNPLEDDLNHPSDAYNGARTSIGAAAALVGWGDSRVKERVKRLDDAEAAWRKEAARSLKAQVKQASPGAWADVSKGGGLEARLTQLRCPEVDAKGKRRDTLDNQCTAALTLRNAGEKTLRLRHGQDPALPTGVFILLDKGYVTHASFTRDEPGDGPPSITLKPGEELEIAFSGFFTSDQPQGDAVGVLVGERAPLTLLTPP